MKYALNKSIICSYSGLIGRLDYYYFKDILEYVVNSNG